MRTEEGGHGVQGVAAPVPQGDAHPAVYAGQPVGDEQCPAVPGQVHLELVQHVHAVMVSSYISI